MVTPAAIVLLGPRLDALDVRRLMRRLSRRPEPVHKPVEQLFWYRSRKFVMRRAVPIGLTVIALLLLLGRPFLGVKWGFPDDRVLPRSASSHQVGDQLRNDFATIRERGAGRRPRRPWPEPAETSTVRRRSVAGPRRVGGVGPGGTFVGGEPDGPPGGATGLADGSAFLTVSSTAPLFSDSQATQLERLHGVPGPAGRPVPMTGSPRSTATASTPSPRGCRWCSG